MPQVGKKHFSYGKAGKAAAKAEAEKTGKPMVNTKAPKERKKKSMMPGKGY